MIVNSVFFLYTIFNKYGKLIYLVKKCYEELLAKDGIEIDGLKNRIK